MYLHFYRLVLIVLLLHIKLQISSANHDSGSEENENDKQENESGSKLQREETQDVHGYKLATTNNLLSLKKDEQLTEINSDSDDSEFTEDVNKDKTKPSHTKLGKTKTGEKGQKGDIKFNGDRSLTNNNTVTNDSLTVTFFKFLHRQRNVKVLFKNGDVWHTWKNPRRCKGCSKHIKYYTCSELSSQCKGKWVRMPKLSTCSFHLDSIKSKDQLCVFPFGKIPKIGGKCDGGKIISIPTLLEECGPSIRTLWNLRKEKRRKKIIDEKTGLLNDVICNNEILCLFNTVYEIGKTNITFYVTDKKGELLYLDEMPLTKKKKTKSDGIGDDDLDLKKMAHSNETDEF